MKNFKLVATAAAALAAVVATAILIVQPASSATEAAQAFRSGPPAVPTGQMALFGHIKTLSRKGRGYVMRFDPAWFTSGVTANTAAAQDGAVPPGQPVPNDNYVVDEGHRLLTYVVPRTARVTVLTKGPVSTPVTVAELARIVNGGTHRTLFEQLETGVWIVVRVDTVRSIDQQYHP